MKRFLSIGSDPEVWLRDSNNNLVSAIKIIDGTKHKPLKTPNGFIQHDGLAAEFNSNPANSLSEFINNHKLIIKDLEDYIKPFDLKIDLITSIQDTSLLLSELGNEEALRSGCIPDYDAWRLAINPRANYHKNSLRCVGGHLHIAFDQAVGSPLNRIKMVRALDMVLGVPSILYDDDKLRRTMYGRAGAFRPKDINDGDSYDGLEYRTLSPFWLKSEEIMEFIYRGVEFCYNNLEEVSNKAVGLKDDIVSIINSGDRERAVIFCKTNDLYTGVLA